MGHHIKKKYTRLFMGIHLVNDENAVNTTCLQEEEKLPPCDIKGKSTIGDDKVNRSHRKCVSKASGNTPKRRAME